MKRLLAAAATTAFVATASLPAFAATNQYGSVKLNWTVSTTAALYLVTQYPVAATFTQGVAKPTLGSAAGACNAASAPASETAFNISFGSVTPSVTAPVDCLYENALGWEVQTNDSNGWNVRAYTDTATANVGFCAFANGAGGASLTTTTRTAAWPAAATFTAGAVSACTAPGVVVAQGNGTENAGTTPGNPGTGSLEYMSYGTTGNSLGSSAAATAGYYQGDDIQLNLNTNAAAVNNASEYITIALIPS